MAKQKPEPVAPLQAWQTNMFAGLDVLSRPSNWLIGPPVDIGVSTDDAIPMLLAVRKRFDVQENSPSFADLAGERFAGKVTGPGSKDGIAALIAETIREIDQKIARCVGTGADAAEIVRTVDFGPNGIFWVDAATFGWSSQRLAAGDVNALPAEHKLRRWMHEDEFYRLDVIGVGIRKAIILGLPDSNIVVGEVKPKSFYLRDDAVRMTQAFRAKQKSIEWSRNEALRREAAEEQKEIDRRLQSARKIRAQLQELERHETATIKGGK